MSGIGMAEISAGKGLFVEGSLSLKVEIFIQEEVLLRAFGS